MKELSAPVPYSSPKNRNENPSFHQAFAILSLRFMWVVNSCQIDQSQLGFVTVPVAAQSLSRLTSREGTRQAWTTEVANPTLCPTLCQLFARCSCAPAHTQTRRPLATDHDLLAIHIPHTRFIHTSRLHIVTFTALSLSALIHSCNEPRCPLLRTPHTHLTLSTVSLPPTTAIPLINCHNGTHAHCSLCPVCLRTLR